MTEKDQFQTKLAKLDNAQKQIEQYECLPPILIE